MHPVLYRSTRPVTLIGGGPVAPDDLDAALARAPHLVAADGGADTARDLGRAASVQAIIGDLDSLTSAENWRKSGVSVHHIPEQNSTDFEKCLYSTDAPHYLGLGFLDGRSDHALSALNTMVRHAGKRIVLFGPSDLCFHAGAGLSIDLPVGSRFSLFPLAPVTGTASEGLRWPVSGLSMAPGGRVGTSNETTEPRVRLGFDAPGMLVLLDPAHLDAVLDADLV